MMLDAALRDILREIIRDELRPLQEQLRSAIELSAKKATADSLCDDALMTVERVAATINVTEATVRSWIKTGALRASRPSAGDKTGRIFRVRRSDLDAFIAGAKSSSVDLHGDFRTEAANIVTLATHKRRL